MDMVSSLQKGFLIVSHQRQSWVTRFALCLLQRTSLTKINRNLVSTFVETLHPYASPFHMSFGEMTITLDDVSCLLHLPIKGVFWTPLNMSLKKLFLKLLLIAYECHLVKRHHMFVSTWVLIISWSGCQSYSHVIEILVDGTVRPERIL